MRFAPRFLHRGFLTKAECDFVFSVKIRSRITICHAFLIFDINTPGVTWPSVGRSSLSVRETSVGHMHFAFNASWSFVTMDFIQYYTDYIWISCISIKRLVSRCNINYQIDGSDNYIFVKKFF